MKREKLTAGQVREKQREYALSRKLAYAQIFDGGNQHLTTVLKDLARFCRANDSTFHVAARAHALIEGRREVWLRIQDHLKLTDDEFLEKYLRGEADGG